MNLERGDTIEYLGAAYDDHGKRLFYQDSLTAAPRSSASRDHRRRKSRRR